MNQKQSRRTIAKFIAQKLLGEPDKKSHWLQILAAYMVDNKMTEDVDLIVNDIASEIHAQTGMLLVDVRSSHPLHETVRAELKQSLMSIDGTKQVVLSEQIDKRLLGGLVARTPDAEVDLSVRTRLEQLANLA